MVVRFGGSAAINAVGVGAAENRHDADVGSKEMLEEDDLKFDGVLNGVGVVLHRGGVAGFGEDFADEVQVGDGFAIGGREGLAGEAEAVGLAVVRGAEDNEGTIGVGGGE